MPQRKNIWKPIVFANSASPPASLPSVVPPAPGSANVRVRTSRQVRRAYHARQAVASTSSGVYLFTGDPEVLPEAALDHTDPGNPSTPPPDFESFPPSSLPPSDAVHGWTSDFPSSPHPASGFAHYRSNRANQWTKWTKIVIPQLVQPYLQLLHRSNSLGSVNRQFSPLCTCGQERARTLKVMCIHFDCESGVSFLP